MITRIQKPVSHFWNDRKGYKPDCIVIHIAEGLRESVYQEFLMNPKSTHYLVNKDGSVWQFVQESAAAWGNGIVHNPTAKMVLDRPNVNPNLYTISIEHEGFEKDGDISETMYATTIELVHDIAERWGIPLDNVHVIRHRDITDQKSCPGYINVERIIKEAGASTTPTTDARKILDEIKDQISQLDKLIP